MIPSDYLMIKRILLTGNRRGHYSLIEKTDSGYIQKEFRVI
jgi:hypothetical protein